MVDNKYIGCNMLHVTPYLLHTLYIKINFVRNRSLIQ